MFIQVLNKCIHVFSTIMMNFLFQHTPFKFLLQDFWRDEAFSYLLAKRNIVEIALLTAKDYNPPLYYYILKIWMFFFGSSEIALRVVSLLCYWGIVYVGFLFLTEVMKIQTKKSLLYLLFFLFNPVLVFYAFEARMYALFAFFTTLSFYAFYTKQTRTYIIATILGLYTHYFMLWVLLSQFLFILATTSNLRQRIEQSKRIFIAFAAFLPWFLFFLNRKPISDSFWIMKTTLQDIPYMLGAIYIGFEKDFGNVLIHKTAYVHSVLFVSLLLLVIIFIGFKKIQKDKPHNRNLFILLSLWSIFPIILVFILSFWKSFFLPRYLLFTVPGLILLVCFALDHMKSKAALLLALLLVIGSLQYPFLLRNRDKEHISRVLHEIRQLAKKDDVLYLTNELDYFTAQYYFDPERVYIYGKRYEELPNYVGKALIPENKLVQKLPFYPQKAFILKSNRSYEISALY